MKKHLLNFFLCGVLVLSIQNVWASEDDLPPSYEEATGNEKLPFYEDATINEKVPSYEDATDNKELSTHEKSQKKSSFLSKLRRGFSKRYSKTKKSFGDVLSKKMKMPSELIQVNYCLVHQLLEKRHAHGAASPKKVCREINDRAENENLIDSDTPVLLLSACGQTVYKKKILSHGEKACKMLQQRAKYSGLCKRLCHAKECARSAGIAWKCEMLSLNGVCKNKVSKKCVSNGQGMPVKIKEVSKFLQENFKLSKKRSEMSEETSDEDTEKKLDDLKNWAK